MGWLKKGLMVGGAVAAMVTTGCGSTQQQRNSTASGSLALSTDDTRLYAADTDNGVVSVIDTSTDTKLYDVKVGARPMRLAVGSDDTLYVANRGSRSVSVIRAGERAPSTEIATGADPTGMAVSFDGKTLYVVSATAKDTSDYGILQAIDTETLEVKYESNLGFAEPRSIALVSNEKALITQYRGGEKGADVVEVNLKTGEVLNKDGTTGLYDQVNRTKVADPNGTNPFGGSFSSFKARAMTDVVVTPDGTRAFVPTVFAREDEISRRPNSSGGYYSAGGPCNVGAVATAGIVTMDTGANATTPQVDDLTNCASTGMNASDVDYPPTTMGISTFGGFTGAPVATQAVQGPSAAAIDPTGEWLFVVNKETSNVAVMPVWRRQAADGEANNFDRSGNSFRAVVAVNNNAGLQNSGADGIALTRDGRRAYVYNQFDHNIVRLGNDQGGPMSDVIVKKTIDLGLKDTLPEEAVKGRRAFFDAMSTQMSSATTHVACSTCHLEGRDDGHVWMFPDGARQTPTLVGRHTTKTQPLHWNGEHADFRAFMTHTVVSRMGGVQPTEELNGQVEAWLEAEPAPENANLRASGLTDGQLRGQALFYGQAECSKCHVGDFLTNDTMANVGTSSGALNTPSLRGLARSAPYLHNGAAATLRERFVVGGGNLHGKTQELSEQQRNDLVDYLKTL